MEIMLNGTRTDCPDGSTVADLLAARNIPLQGTAVARNERVVRKAAYATTTLEPDDRLEIIHAVAGG